MNVWHALARRFRTGPLADPGVLTAADVKQAVRDIEASGGPGIIEADPDPSTWSGIAYVPHEGAWWRRRPRWWTWLLWRWQTRGWQHIGFIDDDEHDPDWRNDDGPESGGR